MRAIRINCAGPPAMGTRISCDNEAEPPSFGLSSYTIQLPSGLTQDGPSFFSLSNIKMGVGFSSVRDWLYSPHRPSRLEAKTNALPSGVQPKGKALPSLWVSRRGGLATVPLFLSSARWTLRMSDHFLKTNFLASAVALIRSMQNPDQWVNARGSERGLPVRRSTSCSQKLQLYPFRSSS